MVNIKNNFSENKPLIHQRIYDNSFVQENLFLDRFINLINIDYTLKSNNNLVSIPFYKTESSILMYMKFFDFFDNKNQKTNSLKYRFTRNVIVETGFFLFKSVCSIQLPIDVIISLFSFQYRLNSTVEWTIEELLKNKNSRKKTLFKATKLTLQSISAPMAALSKGIFMLSIGFEFYISRIDHTDDNDNYFKICKRINDIISFFEWRLPVDNYNERLFCFIQKLNEENDLHAQIYANSNQVMMSSVDYSSK